MAMTRQERLSIHKKQEKLQVSNGVPSVNELTEGVPVLRSTPEGLVEYVRYHGVLHKKVFDRARVKPVIVTGHGLLEIYGAVTSSYSTGTSAGIGIDAVSPTILVGNYNSEIVTTIFIDIGAGLIVSSTGDGDVIGENGIADAFLTKITTKINGLVYGGEMICLEVPTTGNTDINLSSDTAKIAEDTAGTDHTLVDAGGAWTLAEQKDMTIPSGGIQDDYIYFTNGVGSASGTYNAGKFLLRFYGGSTSSSQQFL